MFIGAKSTGVGALLAHRRRATPGGRLLVSLSGVTAAVVGAVVGVDLQGTTPTECGAGLFALVLATAAPLPLVALGSLYHDPLHRFCLPLPFSGGQHLRVGLRLFGGGQWPWAVLVGSAAVTATHHLPAATRATLICFYLAAVIVAGLFSLTGAALCAPIAAASSPMMRNLRASMAGPFSSERHAPFFYLPAIAFATTIGGVSLAEQAILLPLTRADGLAMMRTPLAPALLFAVPVAIAGVLLLLAGWWYARHALRVIAQVHEESRMIYGGRPAPEDPPYGLWVARLLPRGVAPHFRKELREQGRAQRGLWALTVLGLLAAALYGLGTAPGVRAAPLIGLVLLVWVATLPTRRRARDLSLPLMRTLPIRWRSAWAGRWLGLCFVLAHLGAGLAAALGMRNGWTAAATVALAGGTTSLLSVSATSPRAGGRLAPWIPALGLVLGIVALAWPLGGAILLIAVAAAALIWGIWP